MNRKKMNVLFIPAFILMPSPYGPSAQAARQHIPSIGRPNKTGRHPAHAATRYRQAHLSSSPEPTGALHPPWLLRRGETRSKTPPGGRYARTHHPTGSVLAVSSGTLTLSSTPCRRARSRGSPRACARRTSSRASPSGSSSASCSTCPRRGDPSPAPRRLRPWHPRGAPAPSGRRGIRLPQAARSLRW